MITSMPTIRRGSKPAGLPDHLLTYVGNPVAYGGNFGANGCTTTGTATARSLAVTNYSTGVDLALMAFRLETP